MWKNTVRNLTDCCPIVEYSCDLSCLRYTATCLPSHDRNSEGLRFFFSPYSASTKAPLGISNPFARSWENGSWSKWHGWRIALCSRYKRCETNPTRLGFIFCTISASSRFPLNDLWQFLLGPTNRERVQDRRNGWALPPLGRSGELMLKIAQSLSSCKVCNVFSYSTEIQNPGNWTSSPSSSRTALVVARMRTCVSSRKNEEGSAIPFLGAVERSKTRFQVGRHPWATRQLSCHHCGIDLRSIGPTIGICTRYL